MRKFVLLTAAFLHLYSCNRTPEPKPDADRVIKDTLAQIMLQPFNQAPKTHKLHAQVSAEELLRQRDAAIEKLLAEMQSAPQHFVIDGAAPAQVVGSEGTKILFRANSFVDRDGKNISVPVDIELKEYYGMNDLLLNNLILSEERQMLDTKGIISVNAKVQGQEVKLKDGERVNVEFPFAKGKKDKYSFYYGNKDADGQVNWLAATDANQTLNFEPRKFTRPAFVFHGLSVQDYLLSAIKYPDEAKRNELSARIDVGFYVNAEGKVTDVSTGETYKIFRNEILRVLNEMPGWQPATYGGAKVPSMEHVTVDFNIRRTDQLKVEFNESEVTLVDAANYGAQVQQASLTSTSFGSFSKLGWFNCAKEVQLKGAKADLIVRADAKSEIMVVLKNRNMVISGENYDGYSRFKNLPLNAEVYIVALRSDSGNVYYAVQPIKLEKQNVVSLAWKKGGEEEIFKAYKKLSTKV